MPARKTVFELERPKELRDERLIIEILAHGESALDNIPLSEIEEKLTDLRQVLYRRALLAKSPDQLEALRILKSLAEENANALLWFYGVQPNLVRGYAVLQRTWPFNVSVKNLARCRELLDEMKVGKDCLRPTARGKTFKSLWSNYAESIVKSFMYAGAVWQKRRGETPTITGGYAPIDEFRNITDDQLKRIAQLPLPLRADGAKEAWWKEAKPAIEDFWNHNTGEYTKAMGQVDEKQVNVIKDKTTTKQAYVLNQIRDTFYAVVDGYIARAKKGNRTPNKL